MDESEAADILGLKGVVVEQQKRHPKDHFTFGRLRVPLKQQQSSSRSISITITSKEVLLRELAKKLPEAIQQLKLKFNNDAQFELQVIASRGRASPGLADMILNSGKPPGAASSGPGSSSSSASTPTTIATTAPSAASSSSTSSTTNKKKKKKK